jgi:outer membrane protein insertion porin family
VLAAAAGTGAQAAGAPRDAGWLQRRLESGLSAAVGGTVRIGSMDVEWRSLTATVRDVTVSIPAAGAPPLTAALAEGRIKLTWSGLTGIAGGDVHITEIAARGAAFSCSREWIDAWTPAPGGGEGGAIALQVDRLSLDDATAEYADHGARTRVAARGMSFRGDWSASRHLLIGEVRAQASVEAPLFDKPWPAELSGGLRLGSGRLEIFDARGSGPGATAELAGNVTWGAGESFTAQGRLSADLGTLAPYLAAGVPLAGSVDGPVQIVFTNGVPIRITTQAKTTALRLGPVVTERAAADLTIRPEGLDAAAIDAQAYGGTFTGSVALTFGETPTLKTDLAGRKANLARLVALSGRTLPITATADVTLAIEGDPGKLATWTGGGTFAAQPAAPRDGLIPVGGRGRVTFGQGRVRVEADPLTAADSTLRLSLDAPVSGGVAPLRLSLDGTTRDARAMQSAALTLMRSLSVRGSAIAELPLEGHGSLGATLESQGSATRVAFSLDLAQGSFDGEPFDRAAADIAIDDTAVEIRRLDAAGSAGSVRGGARLAVKDGSLDRIDLSARDVDLARLFATLGIEGPVAGRADVDLRGDRDASGLAAAGSLSARNVIVGREIVDAIEAPILVEAGRVILDGVDARAAGARARARVTYDVAAAQADVEILSARLDLASDRTLAEAGLVARGILDLSGKLSVTRDGPTGFVTLAGSDLVIDTGRSGLRDVRLGDVTGTGGISPRGLELAVRAAPDAAWTLESFLGFSETLPVSAVLYFENLIVGLGGVSGETADVRVKGQVQAEGELTAPRDMEINGAFDEVAVRLGPRTLRATEPFPVRLEAGRFVLGPMKLAGDAADLALEARGSLAEGTLASSLKGHLDLAIVSSVWSEIRGAGPIEVDATAGGAIDAPELAGRVTIRGGRLRMVGHAQSLESIDADAAFSGQALTLSSFHALYGGGEVGATGAIEFSGLAPRSFRATVTGTNVAARYPEGFHGTYEGRLTLDGTPKRVMIAGRIDVVRGLYAREFDLGLFGGAHREFEAAAESPLPRNVMLDIDVVAPGNVWLRNDIAKVEAQGQVHIGGELARPEITGHMALLPGGTVRYRDVDYRIDSGTLDLTDPKRINPYVDLRGRTRVADYDIALHVEGTVDKFDYELTSTPPLATQDIISVLVTGKTLDTLAGSASAAAIPGDMAAYYFAGLLTSTFGKQIQSSLGIDQLEVTPLLVKGESDPTARVTVGKQVTDSVKILFSQDIGTAQSQTYQVRWDATRKYRFIAESDTETGLGGEVQYSQQFGGTPVALRQSTLPPASAPSADPPGSVAAVSVVQDDGTPRPDLVKAAKLRVGGPFDRGRTLQAGERIRDALLKKGYIQGWVRTEVTFDEGTPRAYKVEYRVTPGPRVAVKIVMTGGGGTRGPRRTLKAYWRETAYTPDFWDEATRTLLEQLQEDGYYVADVTWSAEDGPKGRTVKIAIDRGKKVKLRTVRFTGVASIPMARIEKQMTSMKAGGLRRRVLRPGVLADDLAAVRALYRDEGFTRVRVGLPQIALTTRGDAADVDVAIEEGTKFTVGETTFSATPKASDEEMQTWTAYSKGDTFSPRRLAEAEQSLKDQFDVRGYPDATVSSEVEFEDRSADIAFDVEPGDRKTVGEVAIEGNRVTKNRTIAKALTFGRGDVVSNAALLKSQQQLYRTGLFSSVRLSCEPMGGDDPAAQTVTVKVEEAPPFSLALGAGYDSSDGPRASFLLGYSNLGGRNIGIAVQGRFSPKDNLEVLTVRRRRIFGNTIDSLASLLNEKTVHDSFTESQQSLSIRLEQRPKPRWIRFLRYSIQSVDITDITDVQAAVDEIFENKLSNQRLASLGVGLVRDTRDDAFVPTRGGYGSVEGNVFAQPLGSQSSFFKTFIRGSWTVTLKGGSRFASFLRIGAEYPFGDTQLVPLSERFFAGGSNTLRGFATDEVGGLTIDGFKAGGEALFILNEEWHYPIWRSLWGELFIDAGNVYPTLSDFNPTDLRSSAGTGLRLDTPIGPLRIEYGWKLDRREGESAGEIIFAIGTVF